MPSKRLLRPLLSRLSLKLLSLIVVCCVLPSFLLGLTLLRSNEEVLRARVHEGLEARLLRTANNLHAWSEERLREAVRWSASFVVYEGVETLTRTAGPDRERVRRDLRDYLDSVQGHYPVYESLFIVDRSGKVLASTRSEHLERWGTTLLAKGLGDRAVMSPLHRSEITERPTLLVLQPIQGRSGVVVGYFVERIAIRELESQLGGPPGDQSLRYWLLDERGGMLVRGGYVPDWPGRDVLLRPSVAAPPLSIAVGEGTLPTAGQTVHGVCRLAPPLGGYLVATLPTADGYQPLLVARQRIVRPAIVVFVLMLTVVVWSTRGILRPVSLLLEAARRVASGDLDVYLPVRGRDEIAALTSAFNEMARRLREGRQSLEEARDELARTNEGLKVANSTLETLAITDGLTGLYNHRHFQVMIEKEIRRCDREGRMLSLLMLDLDHFKQYNDQWGHTQGDAALQTVAGQIMRTVRLTDIAFRYGGEELAILLPSCSKDQAIEVAEKIRVSVASVARRPSRATRPVTISIGVATFPEDGRVARALVDVADAALYTAKAQGRNRVIAAGRFRASEDEGAELA
jgi:diguanylate cyclase (GGDEF)-like protein